MNGNAIKNLKNKKRKKEREASAAPQAAPVRRAPRRQGLTPASPHSAPPSRGSFSPLSHPLPALPTSSRPSLPPRILSTPLPGDAADPSTPLSSADRSLLHPWHQDRGCSPRAFPLSFPAVGGPDSSPLPVRASAPSRPAASLPVPSPLPDPAGPHLWSCPRRAVAGTRTGTPPSWPRQRSTCRAQTRPGLRAGWGAPGPGGGTGTRRASSEAHPAHPGPSSTRPPVAGHSRRHGGRAAERRTQGLSAHSNSVSLLPVTGKEGLCCGGRCAL